MISKRKLTYSHLVIFIVLATITALGIRHLQQDVAWMRSDILYFVLAFLFSIAVFFKSDVQNGIRTIYMLSINFFFAFFFLDTKVAILGTILFFIPALVFQKEWINEYLLGIITIIVAFFLYYFFGYIFLLPLYMPICFLFAKKTTSGFQVRFTNNAHDNENLLSLKQKKMRSLHKRGVFALFLAHLDDLLGMLAMLGEEEREKKVTDYNELYSSKLLKLQNSQTMSDALTKIKARDNMFDPDDMLMLSLELFKKIQNAWYAQEIEKIEHIVSDSLYEQFRNQISNQLDSGIQYKCRKLEVLDQRIAYVYSDENFDYIVVFIRATTLDSLVDIETKKSLVENKEARPLVEYWTFVRRPGTKTLKLSTALSDNCPNCGSPIIIGHSTICSSCNSFLRSGEYNWVLSNITQGSEWENLNPSLIPGWQEMKKDDHNFTLQSAEDLASVIFWKIRLAQKTKNTKLLCRFATKKMCSSLIKLKSKDINTGSYLKKAFEDADYMEDVSLASVGLKAISVNNKVVNKLYLLVVWSGVPVKLDKDGVIGDFIRLNCIARDVYVLTRAVGVQSNISHTITSAHCKNCGASSEGAFTNYCNYCETLLNDENSSWVLEKITTEKDLEYRKLVGKVSKNHKSRDENKDSSMAETEIITVLAQVMIVDKNVNADEVLLLKRMAAKHNISDQKVNSIVKKLRNGMIYIPTPEVGYKALNLLASAIKMAMVDGKIDDSERKVIYSLGKQLGQDENDIRRAIHFHETNHPSS